MTDNPDHDTEDFAAYAERVARASALAQEQRVREAIPDGALWNDQLYIPKVYQGKRLEPLRVQYPEKVAQAERALAEGLHIVIHGKTGRGKSHLGVALLYVKLERSLRFAIDPSDGMLYVAKNPLKGRMRFLAVEEFVDRMKTAAHGYDSNGESGLLRGFAAQDVLLLDDVGLETGGERAREWLSVLLDRRHRMQKQTLLTTNHSPEDLARMVDARVVARLMERGIFIHLDGPDYRRTIHTERMDTWQRHPLPMRSPKK